MQEVLALLAPAIIALGFFNHLHRDAISIRKLIFNYGLFVVLVNLCTYSTILFVLGYDGVYFDHKSIVIYLIISTIFAFILPFVINLIENSVAIEVTRNDKK